METINVIVEIPAGSQNKYEMDHETNMTRWVETATRSTRSC